MQRLPLKGSNGIANVTLLGFADKAKPSGNALAVFL